MSLAPLASLFVVCTLLGGILPRSMSGWRLMATSGFSPRLLPINAHGSTSLMLSNDAGVQLWRDAGNQFNGKGVEQGIAFNYTMRVLYDFRKKLFLIEQLRLKRY